LHEYHKALGIQFAGMSFDKLASLLYVPTLLLEIIGAHFPLRHTCFLVHNVFCRVTQVIEPRWHEMEQKMAAATDMDAVLTSHAELQDLILKECLLTNQDLLKVLTKIMTICLLFAEQVVA